MNAVDLNIKHQNFQLVIRRRRRLATGSHKTSFHNLCFRTAVAQTSGGEIRPSLFEQFCEGDRTANRSDFANASPSLASALGANDGKAIIDAPETASIAKAAQHRVPFSSGSGELDEAAAFALAQMLRRRGYGASAEKADALSMSKLFSPDLSKTVLVCICYVDRSSSAEIRYAVRRLTKKRADAVVLAFWAKI